jgi:DNA-binding response OmpR family regulator
VGAKILLVDDDKDRRDSARVFLMLGGYHVVEAADSKNAFSLLASERFDLILLDITVPDKSGFLVLEFLKEKNLASKVIVITGTVGLENAIKSAAYATPDHVTKPYVADYVLKSIKHILDQSQTIPKIQIIKAGDLIKSTPTGDLDMIASKHGLAEIAATGVHLHDYAVLIDLRDVKSRLTTADIYELAFELVKYGETFRRKTAVLAREDEDIDQAMFFEIAAQNRGFDVKTFTVFEEAMNWLSSTTSSGEDQ